MNADAMTDEQYRIYKFSNFFDLKNLPNDEFERSKRFEDSNILNCSSVIASAFICHLAQKISGTENVNTPFSRISEMMISLFFGFNTTPKGFLSVVLGPIGIFHFGGISPLSS